MTFATASELPRVFVTPNLSARNSEAKYLERFEHTNPSVEAHDVCAILLACVELE
jgi:hypothetical protein